MSIWGVQPEQVRYDLVYRTPDGVDHQFWIRVKKFLTVGEERRVMTAGWRGINTGQGEISIDWKAQTFARTAAYLTDWSLADEGGNKLTLNRDCIESLNSEVYDLIENQISQHVAAVTEEKKVPSGSAPQSPTSA